MSTTDALPRLRHDAARRRPAGGAEPLRRRQAHHRAPARRPRGRLHRGRLAGREPQGHRVLPPGPRGARPARTRRSPPSAPTRRAGVPAADDPLVAALRDSGAGVVTLVAKSHDRHVELALRTTLEENLAMVRDTVRHLRAEGQRVFLDAEHFFDGYRDNRDYALEVLRTAAEAGAEVVALCDTNGGMLPAWVADVVARRPRDHRASGSASTATTTPAARSPTRSPRSTPAPPRAGHAQRVRRAHRQRRPGRGGGQPRAQARPPGAARRPAARGHPDRARGRRGDQRPAGVPPAVRRRQRVRAQGRAARQRDQGRPEPLPAHRPGRRRQRHAAAGLRHGRPREHRAEGRASSASTCAGDRTLVTRITDRVKELEAHGLHLRGRRRVVRAAARRGGRGRPPVVLRRRVVAGDHRLAARRRRRSPRRPSSCAPAAPGSSPPARATARSTRSTTRCARRSGRPTRRSRSSS